MGSMLSFYQYKNNEENQDKLYTVDLKVPVGAKRSKVVTKVLMMSSLIANCVGVVTSATGCLEWQIHGNMSKQKQIRW